MHGLGLAGGDGEVGGAESDLGANRRVGDGGRIRGDENVAAGRL